MKRSGRPAETAIAGAVVDFLRALGWRVYQEVQSSRGGARPDIVATWRDRLVWIVECKTALSWDLLAQAADWRGRAHRVSVAVPPRHGHRTYGPRTPGLGPARTVEEEVLDALGLGGLEAGPTGVREIRAPRLQVPSRRELQHWWRTLRPEHEAGFAAAGTCGGGYFTPFRGTVRAIVAELRERPGLTTKELVAAVDHHYGADAAAAKNMVRWLGTTALEGSGLVARRDGPAGPWRWSVDLLAETLGRCEEPICSLAATARCARCARRLCGFDVADHRCRCTARDWGCSGPIVRACGCQAGARRAPLCGEHHRCWECDEKARRSPAPGPEQGAPEA